MDSFPSQQCDLKEHEPHRVGGIFFFIAPFEMSYVSSDI